MSRQYSRWGGNGGSRRGGNGGGGNRKWWGKDLNGGRNGFNSGGRGGGRGMRGRTILDRQFENFQAYQEEGIFFAALLPLDDHAAWPGAGRLVNIAAWQDYLNRAGFANYCLGRIAWLFNSGMLIEGMGEWVELLLHLVTLVKVEQMEPVIGRIDLSGLAQTCIRLMEMMVANPEAADIFMGY